MKRLQLFIVEDSPIFIKSLCNVISNFTIHRIVGIADTAEKGIDLIQKTNPDLVLMDISIPNMGGIRFIYELRKLEKTPKIIVLSLENDQIYLKLAYAAHADDFLWKVDVGEKLIPSINRLFPEIQKTRLKPLQKESSKRIIKKKVAQN